MRLVKQIAGALAVFAASALGAAAHAQTLPADGDPCGILEWEETYDANARMIACAERDIAEAQAYLAIVYWTASEPGARPEYRGLPRGLNQDQLRAEGRRLMEAAAEGGAAVAQNELGLALLDGQYGMDVDFVRARHWLELADAGGDALAPFNLARLYHLGLGVEQSDAETHRLLRVAIERGHRPAMCSMAALLLRESPPDMGEVVRLRQAAAEFEGPCTEYDLMPELRR